MKSGEEEDFYIQFEAQYREELFAHMSKTRNRYISTSARFLGNRAFSHEINLSRLATLHTEVMGGLVTSELGESSAQLKSFLSRSGAFLNEAILVVESKTEQSNRTLNLECQELKRKLDEESARCKKLVASSKKMEKQAKIRARQFIVAQEEERKQISRELHDQIAQTLAGINLRLSAIKRIATEDTKTLKRKIAQTQQLVERSVKTIHSFAKKLRPTMLDDLGLIPSLRALFKDLPNPKRLKINFSAYPEVESLSNQCRTVLYRVVQEALTNVVRHAKANIVEISITKDAEMLHLKVADDGKSFKVDESNFFGNGNRLGLLGMRERVEMIGGIFFISSLPGRGTSISVDIPIGSSNRI